MSFGLMILLNITLKSIIDSQNIWRRFIGWVLMNITPSNILKIGQVRPLGVMCYGFWCQPKPTFSGYIPILQTETIKYQNKAWQQNISYITKTEFYTNANMSLCFAFLILGYLQEYHLSFLCEIVSNFIWYQTFCKA